MADADAPPAPSPPGRRARNKADKLRRITLASRELFAEKGFDRTTMRDIAARAEVGFGTLFDYAGEKRDLLFMLFNPELERVLDHSVAAAETETDFIDRLMAVFGGYYAFYGRDRVLAHAVLRELNFFSEGAEARKFLDHRSRFLGAIADQVAHGMASGALRPNDPVLVGRAIFALYAWELRRWLASDAPSLARGLDELRQLLALQVAGFGAVSAPPRQPGAAPDRRVPAVPRSAP